MSMRLAITTTLSQGLLFLSNTIFHYLACRAHDSFEKAVTSFAVSSYDFKFLLQKMKFQRFSVLFCKRKKRKKCQTNKV